MTQSRNWSTNLLRSHVHQALTLWHQEGAEFSPLQDLYLFQVARHGAKGTSHQTTNQLILHALRLLETNHEQEAVLLRRRFLENELVHRIANDWSWAESTLYRKQNKAIDHLTEILQDLEEQAHIEQKLRLRQRLESPLYTELIGVEDHLARLTSLLIAPRPPWIIALEGMGGIGKTSLADALLRHLWGAEHFADLGWVTMRQQIFNLDGSIKPVTTPIITTTALVDALLAQLNEELPPSAIASPTQARNLLTSRLKARPYLLVLDNLEALADVESLLPLLRDLSNPTKFVLTSRDSLYAEASIYHFAVPELNDTYALRLIGHEASLRNLWQVIQASDAELKPILEKVGGNPLALRLIVGQMHVHGLDMVLADLTSARGPTTQNFYSYVYRRAWEYLDETARHTLLALPRLTEAGGTLNDLAAVCGLGKTEVSTALDKLVMLNLVSSRGGLNARHYTISHLTRTFLQQAVTKWPS